MGRPDGWTPLNREANTATPDTRTLVNCCNVGIPGQIIATATRAAWLHAQFQLPYLPVSWNRGLSSVHPRNVVEIKVLKSYVCTATATPYRRTGVGGKAPHKIGDVIVSCSGRSTLGENTLRLYSSH